MAERMVLPNRREHHANSPEPDASTCSWSGASARHSHLTQQELARRWRMSPRTLERWRWLKKGPPYLALIGRVLYRLEDDEAFEAAHRYETSNSRFASALT